METHVHTIEARDNIMLEVLRDYFSLTPTQILTEIQGLLAQTTAALTARGLSYDSLGPALVPSQKRKEAALVFDSSRIDDARYGSRVYGRVLPLFPTKGCHSVLAGDLLGPNERQVTLRDELEAALVPASELEYQHSTQFFFVYINNLTSAMLQNFHTGLAGYAPYVGYVDCTYGGFMKEYLSTCLPASFIQSGRTFLQQHEDDLDEDANQNTLGYPFEEHGYEIKSVPSTMYGTLLSYKIERPVFRGFESDTELSLNAVSSIPSRLDGFEVRVDAAKLGYLASNKSGSLKRAGLLDADTSELENMIRGRLQSNYIYNLRRLHEHDVVTFNTLIETNRTRLMVALKYLPNESTIRLVTMY